MQRDREATSGVRTCGTSSQIPAPEHEPQPRAESSFPTQCIDKGRDMKYLEQSTPGLLALDLRAGLTLKI